MYFKLKGEQHYLSRTHITLMMKGVKPEHIRKYYVIIDGHRYPIKQVISICLNLGKSEFGTVDAGPILTRLGFKLHWR